jgi:membrane protease YdiL (CAAX protease family)
VTSFQLIALLSIATWLVLVIIWFRRSGTVMIGGLAALGLFTLLCRALGIITASAIGLGTDISWLSTLALALGGLAAMILYSPLADRLASMWFSQPPTLERFRVVQQSRLNLILGIAVAWLLGGILEELVARGIVLNAFAAWLSPHLGGPVAAGIAICIAAAGAGLAHLYQGPRAVLIIMQLSVLFGILFVISGYNLWTVMLCHGLFDTIALVKFASGRSRYAGQDNVQAS